VPLTKKGSKIKAAMQKQYGAEKGESVFYASKNAGKITGVEDKARHSAVKHMAKQRAKAQGK
jgi:hypothetical protein